MARPAGADTTFTLQASQTSGTQESGFRTVHPCATITINNPTLSDLTVANNLEGGLTVIDQNDLVMAATASGIDFEKCVLTNSLHTVDLIVGVASPGNWAMTPTWIGAPNCSHGPPLQLAGEGC
ncbi:hypothetical protein [Nonomuraea sp. NPDC003709]|uniref:hypothetical protein n=1 Tax=Nonomuraea sp. NPDC003709 TaxID=3154450 RepID=UPI0033BC616E